MTVAARRSRQPKLLAAGALEGEISSFRLQLAAEGKSPKTIRMYTEAVRWFAAAHLLRETGRTCWEQVCGQDVQRWMVWLLSNYSDSYASNQYRALQQFLPVVGRRGRASQPHGQAPRPFGAGQAH